MSSYLEMLHEIEAKKEDLESKIAQAIAKEIALFQSENDLPVKDIYVSLVDVTTVDEPKRYTVSSVYVDIDFKP